MYSMHVKGAYYFTEWPPSLCNALCSLNCFVFFLRGYFTSTKSIFLDIYLHLLSLPSYPVQISSVFQKYEELIETLHISDQYTGVIDDTAEDDSGGVVVKVPERKIIFTYTGECSNTPGLL